MESNTWAKVDETILEFEVQNPHREGSAAYSKFEAIKQCSSVGEAKLREHRPGILQNTIRRDR